MYLAQIKDVLVESNCWWKEEFSVEFKPRAVYREISGFLSTPQILSFTGLRRVGKTTLMLKIAEDFIRNGFDPRNVVYFSFDEFKGVEIRDVLNEYQSIVDRDLAHGKYLFLFDEIQKLEGWDEQLKRIYDVYKGRAKIIISGSESLFVKRKSKESLAGRLFEFKLEQLSFEEFLKFKNARFKPVALYERELKKLFEEFVLTQGFPELVGVKEKRVIRKYIKESIVDKVVYRDLLKLFEIRDLSALESLINIIMSEPGQIMEVSSLAGDIGISRQSLSNYLGYLEDSFLVRKLYNYSKNRRKIERKLRKYYPAIVSPDLLFKEDALSRSKVFEWFIVNQLKAEFFWRDPYKNEVDIVIPSDKPVPVEVKFGKISTTGLLRFMKKFKVNQGYIVSSDVEKKEKINSKSVIIKPAFKFLLQNPLQK